MNLDSAPASSGSCMVMSLTISHTDLVLHDGAGLEKTSLSVPNFVRKFHRWPEIFCAISPTSAERNWTLPPRCCF